LTPPFGATLFYMKGTVPPSISMTDIYKSMPPWVVLQVIGLALCMIFPGIVLWLPRVADLLD
jgi:TRAP-type mannitol/chloroaromatic compound transport system permease large subunit